MPPHGALIEEAREKARLSRREAARRAGISGNWWKFVVTGYQGETPVRGGAETVARMARVVGLSPERLESDGQRPDAAEILREIERRAAADTAATGRQLAEAAAEDDDLREIAEAARLSPELRMAFITLARAMKAAREEQSASG